MKELMLRSDGLERQDDRYVRVGLVGVGPGSIAQRFHIPCLRRIPQARIEAVASRSGTSIGLPVRAYRDPAEMFAAEQLDLVYVMSPTSTHPPIVMAALARGVHVVCEKPPALTVVDTADMVLAAKDRDRSLMFCYNRRFAPTYVRLKQLAVEQGCHTLILVKTRGASKVITPETIKEANRHWQEQSTREGTPIFEFAPHLFDLALWINGPVLAHDFSARRLYGSSVNLSAIGHLEHQNGAHSIVVYEEVTGSGTERVTLYGPALTAEATGGMFSPNQLRVDVHGQTDVFPSSDDPLEYSGFLRMSQHIVECVARGQVYNSSVDSTEVMQLALAFDPPAI